MDQKPVAVVIGATSKWQSDGRNTRLIHGDSIEDGDLPLSVRWGLGGALALKFAAEGYHVVPTTRSAANAEALAEGLRSQDGTCSVIELDLASPESIEAAFAKIRADVGEPEVVILNAGYLDGRDLPKDQELLEHMPVEIFETAQHVSSRGPFLVAKQIMPAMRERGRGSFLITNNAASLRGQKRYTGQSLYYPRGMMRTLAQALTEEYSEYGVHIAHVIVDGLIDSPGTRALPIAQKRPEIIMNPAAIADSYFYLHCQDKSCWTHEIQLTPYSTKPSF